MIHAAPTARFGRGGLRLRIRALLSRELLAGGLVIAALLFNPILAFVNANLVPLAPIHVMAAEALIVAAALALIAVSWRMPMLLWVWTMAVMLLLWAAMALFGGYMDAKFLRDVWLIPIFIMVGMVFYKGDIVRFFVLCQSIVLVVIIWEAIAPTMYGDILNIKSYYINTRNLTENDFWNTESNLFISATRPGDRFLFGFLGLHRLSSIFLEPVTLGNYVIITVAFALTFWSRMTRSQKVFFVASIFIILVGSDGRLAFTTSLLLVLVATAARFLPKRFYVLYLPLSLFCAFYAQWLFQLQPQDTFDGRIAFSVKVLKEMDLASFLGMNAVNHWDGADSGIAYFILTQSVFGVVFIWVLICGAIPLKKLSDVRMMHAIAAFFSLTLLISFSIFSIKTGALLWFMYGYVYAVNVNGKRVVRERLWSGAVRDAPRHRSLRRDAQPSR